MVTLDLNQIMALFFGLLVAYLLIRLLYLPAKLFFRLLGNTVVGGGLLLLFNVVGSYFGVTLGLNILTALLVGLLGTPGILLLVVLQKLSA